jgi:hypothetical protein
MTIVSILIARLYNGTSLFRENKMKPIDLSENNSPITPDQVETPVGCGGTCGGKCGCSSSEAVAQGTCKKNCCGGKKCCCCMKILIRIVIAAAWFSAGYLYSHYNPNLFSFLGY